MVKVSALRNSIFLDTAPLIYYIEHNSEYNDILIRLFEANDRKKFAFVTSSITLLEVLVKPLREGNTLLAEQYKEILINAEGIEIINVDNITAIKAAELRAKYNLRTPDSIQLATAILTGTSYFLTNDFRLKNITEANIITLAELE